MNGYRHPAGRWIEGCSRVPLSDESLLSALVQAASDRGLGASDVAAVWARKAPAIAKRAAQADDSDAYFQAAILDELMVVNPAKPKPAVPIREGVDVVTSLPDVEFKSALDKLAFIALEKGWQWIHPGSDCPRCAGFGRDVDSETLCDCYSGQHLRDQELKLKRVNVVMSETDLQWIDRLTGEIRGNTGGSLSPSEIFQPFPKPNAVKLRTLTDDRSRSDAANRGNQPYGDVAGTR